MVELGVRKLITAEEFWRQPETHRKRELVRGEVVESMPPGGQHGVVALAIGSELRAWARSGPGGFVGVESGFVLSEEPDTVRAPDVAYVSAERIPKAGIPRAFWRLAPDLAVEVVSPDDTAAEIQEKVRDYIDAGTPLVWVAYPSTREILAHSKDGTARRFGPDDTLEAETLPGFSCRVATLFE